MLRTLGLIKFGERRFMQAFLDGAVYMQPLSSFTSGEGEPERYDIREGDASWIHGATISIGPKVGVEGPFVPIGGLIDPIRYRDSAMPRQNIYCMFAIDGAFVTRELDPRLLEFGDTCVLITNGDEFLSRVERIGTQLGHQVIWRRVTYVDEASHHGSVGPFTKADIYSHQFEFRIILKPGTGAPLTLQIGDIRDIAILGDSKDIFQRLDLDPANSQLRVSS
jgi:hypothetical protein